MSERIATAGGIEKDYIVTIRNIMTLTDRKLELSLQLEHPAVQDYLLQALRFIEDTAETYRIESRKRIEAHWQAQYWQREGRERIREATRWADDGGRAE